MNWSFWPYSFIEKKKKKYILLNEVSGIIIIMCSKTNNSKNCIWPVRFKTSRSKRIEICLDISCYGLVTMYRIRHYNQRTAKSYYYIIHTHKYTIILGVLTRNALQPKFRHMNKTIIYYILIIF